MSYLEELVASVPVSTKSADFQGMLSEAAERHGIPDKLPILKQILRVESGGKVNARSPKGASGLMQLMPKTARGLGVQNIFDPYENIDAGVRYFKQQIDTFGDDALALAAYNAGPGAVKKFGNKIPPYKETQKYVKTIMGNCGDAANCGDAVALSLNPMLPGKKLPRGGLGEGQIREVAEYYGAPVFGKQDITLESLQGLGPGTIIRMTRRSGEPNYKYGDTHAEMVDTDPQTGQLVIKSFTSDKGTRIKPLTQEYINTLPKQVIATNLTQKFRPQNMPTNMVADVSGQATPAVPYQTTPEKERTLSQILGEAASAIGPKEAAAAEPPKDDWLMDIVKGNDIKPEMPTNLPPSGETKGVYYPPSIAPVGKTGVMAKMPSAPQTKPPDMITLGKAAMVDDPQARFKILAKARFPGQPDKWKDYFTDEAGNIKYVDKGIVYPEVPKETWEKAKSFIATEAIGRGPENVGAGIGYKLGGPAGAAVGGFFGSAARQKFAVDFLGDKPKDVSSQVWTAAKEALAGGMGGMVGKGIVAGERGAFRTAARTGLAGKLEQQFGSGITKNEIQKFVDLYNRYGITYTVAEISNSPTLQGLVQMLSMIPGSAKEKISVFQRSVRVPQINKAIQQELGKFAGELSTAEAGQVARDTASGIEKTLIANRKLGASKFYEMAKQSNAQVDAQPIIDSIDDMMQYVAPGGAEASALKEIKNLFFDGDQLLTNPGKLKSVRDNINMMISGDYKPELKGAVNSVNREATLIKKQLTEKLHEASPDIVRGDTEFARLSKPLNEYLWGTTERVGGKPSTLTAKISRITNEEQLDQVPGKIFQSTPKAISNMREWFVSNGYEEEWNKIVRGMLESRLDKVKANVVNDQMGLKGANFAKKAFGDPDFQRKFQAALTPDQFKSLSDFFELMEQTGKIVYTNSQTTPMARLIEVVRSSSAGPKDIPVTMAKAYRTLHEILFSPGKAIDRYEAHRLLEKQDILWDAMLNPVMAARLARIKKLPPNLEKAQEFMILGLSMTGKHETEGEKNVEPARQPD